MYRINPIKAQMYLIKNSNISIIGHAGCLIERRINRSSLLLSSHLTFDFIFFIFNLNFNKSIIIKYFIITDRLG